MIQINQIWLISIWINLNWKIFVNLYNYKLNILTYKVMPGPGLRSQVLPPGNLPHDEMEPVSIENNKQKQQQQQLQQQQQQQHSNGDGMVECKACGDRFA